MSDAQTPTPEAPAPLEPARPPVSTRLKVVFLLVIMLMGLVGVELAIRVRDWSVGLGFFNEKRNKLYNTPDAVIPFRIFGVRPYVNAGKITARWGQTYPLEKPAGTIRIITMGGSTTEDKSNGKVRWPEELNRVLCEKLGRTPQQIEVINLGNSAYATPHLLIHLELDVISWKPDVVIACENINDLLVNYFPDFKPDYSNAYADPYFALPDFSKHFTFTSMLCQHFQLYWILLDRWDKLDLEGKYKMRRETWGDRPLPGEEIFRRNWTSFATLARANGIQALLAAQALDAQEKKFVLHNGIKPYNWRVKYPQHAEFVEQHKRYNQIVEEVARETGVLFVDNDAALGGRDELFMDHVHYTEAGSRRLAENYAAFLIKTGIVK